MIYCKNCESLQRSASGWSLNGYPVHSVSVNCGNHEFIDSMLEDAIEKVAEVKKEYINYKLKTLGFDEVAFVDISLTNTGFYFAVSCPLQWHQIDKLKSAFGTNKINFVRDGGYHDTYGYHEENYIEVLDCNPWF